MSDRKYISRYGTATFAVVVTRNGVPASADGPVSATLTDDSLTGPEAVIWTGPANQTSTGTYEVVLSSMQTQAVGDYTLTFAYSLDGTGQVYGYEIEVGPASPAYDALGEEWLGAVDAVWAKFADLFDSPYGGPNLQVYIQTNFNRGRLAQLLPVALQRLNSASAPHVTHEFNGTSFPFANYGGLLAQSLYIEVLKHLVRSYVEQPEVILGTAVSRVDRRDYMNRWSEVLQMEQGEFERDLSRYRQANMGLGNFHVLVSGGAFGNIGPYVNAGGGGAAAARGYFSVHRAH